MADSLRRVISSAYAAACLGILGMAGASAESSPDIEEIGYLASQLLICASHAYEEGSDEYWRFLDVQIPIADAVREADGTLPGVFHEGISRSLDTLADKIEPHLDGPEVALEEYFTEAYCEARFLRVQDMIERI